MTAAVKQATSGALATVTIEQLIDELKDGYTIFVATHNLHQAVRVAGYKAFFHLDMTLIR